MKNACKRRWFGTNSDLTQVGRGVPGSGSISMPLMMFKTSLGQELESGSRTSVRQSAEGPPVQQWKRWKSASHAQVERKSSVRQQDSR